MAMYKIEIPLVNTDEFCAVVAGLVREGICFTASMGGEAWIIEMTGGN